MSINGNGNAEIYSHSASGDNEGNETVPLLSNRSRAKGASFASSVFNLMNAIMGSGILGLAYAMASTGIVGFCFLLILVSSLAAYSIHLLLKLCDMTGINSYEDLGGRALQKPGKVLVGIAILIQNVGAMSSYLFILKSELPAAITSFLSPDQTGYQIPLTRNARPNFSSSPVRVPMPSPPWPSPSYATQPSCQSTVNWIGLPKRGCRMLPMSASASASCFTWFLPSLAISPSTVGHGTESTLKHSTKVACLVVCFCLPSARVDSELLLGYDAYMPRDIMVMMVRVAIIISVLLTVPLIHFPARKAVILLLCGNRPFSWMIHITTTLVILGVVHLLAIFVPDIRNVFGVVGSTTSSCLLFVFPGLFYFKISHQPRRSFDSIGAVCLVVFGLMVGVVSFSIIIFTWIHGSS
ncbi:probable sodium-coupled neutral amino acid transporter 6 isoform X4 [Phyllopteryx taeniolatus]|uniref:probable sodium-coupled neutral amino acid transporter 6 isoform X4 n=1 Tax=Phyllopteryx taeniolatus TaxID=161469 RepID=UPI002AD5585E|nr:probable sodium-coupled neutral amino acid transporter 6 isoform X4 [Phyllopteryx taeniolatus]